MLHVSRGARDQGVTQGFVTDIESNGLKIIQIHNLEEETLRFKVDVRIVTITSYTQFWYENCMIRSEVLLESVIKSRNTICPTNGI